MIVKKFFKLADGTEAALYSLRNGSGFGADVTDCGGALVSLFAPDRSGRMVDVLLGYRDPALYLSNPCYFGALIGRYANRIAGGRFSLDGKEYVLECNDSAGPNTLHGGLCYGRRMWQARVVGDTTLELNLTSPDGDAGFPGRVEVTVVYHVTEANALELSYRAVSDAVTVVSMTNHAYFNLNGESAGNCDGHFVRIAADRRTEVDAFLAPTGRNPEVAGTVYDLRSGCSFEEIHRRLPRCFDDNFVLGDRAGEFRRDIAAVRAESTGIEMRVSTDAPGVQFYMGYFLDGSAMGKSGFGYPQYSAFCLETQLWPDAVHHPEFPSARLAPGEVYTQRTVYAFSAE